MRTERGVRLLIVKTGIDVTAHLERFSQRRASALAGEDLSGYVLERARRAADSSGCAPKLRLAAAASIPPRLIAQGLIYELLEQ